MSRNHFFILIYIAVISSSGFGFMATSDPDDISGVINYLFKGGNSKAIGVPTDPRTVIKLEEKTSSPTRVTVGLKTSILGAIEGELKTEVEYDRDFSVTTWIFVEGENADVIKQNPGGSYYFDPGNRRAVRLCSISASWTLSQSYIGKVFLAVQGVEKVKKYSGIEEVLQTSGLVEVKPGESPETHKKACDEFAKRKYAEVNKSLSALASSRIYWDELSQCNPVEKITRDSVCGKWHRELFPSVQRWTEPVCERRVGQHNYFCNIHSIKGGACPYRDSESKKLLTSGMFEYRCAKGLECVLTKAAGWFNYAEAECRPVQDEAATGANPLPFLRTHSAK